MMRDVRGLLIDLDGTVYEGDEAVAGAADALADLDRRGVPHLFTTNTSRMSRRAVSARLAELGLAIPVDRVLTAPMAAALWLARENITRAHLLLPESTREDFEGIAAVGADEAPEAVVVGDLGRAFTFERLNEAFRALRGGARLVAIHRNRFWLPPDGPTLDAGPFVVGLEYAAGVEAVLVGKPSPTFFELAVARLGVDREGVAVVGDDPESDVRGARAAGIRSIQVRTGKGRVETPGAGAGADLRLESIAAIGGVVDGAGANRPPAEL
ncbi:MAG TPA: TIGR01458 family HAD-type hydrolase [Longimicrobiales bacterium]|nr:TIGR01458 family HAD-type hydrolase [Longimicrobiales bacterium]